MKQPVNNEQDLEFSCYRIDLKRSMKQLKNNEQDLEFSCYRIDLKREQTICQNTMTVVSC